MILVIMGGRYPVHSAMAMDNGTNVPDLQDQLALPPICHSRLESDHPKVISRASPCITSFRLLAFRGSGPLDKQTDNHPRADLFEKFSSF